MGESVNSPAPVYHRRPIYESERDIAAEMAARKRFEEKFGCETQKVGGHAHFDTRVWRSVALVGHAEFKRRYNLAQKYPTFAISLTKVAYARWLRLPAIFVIQWDDAIGWVRAEKPDDVKMGGRTDRGDPRDREMMAHFWMSRFRMFGGGPDR